ncbi:Glycogenin-1 [Liparis tanakae]|uniref:glycogenin glucosyltransferase n=1 Tax=Liparis tanakae TaxID=230148 RepID=A0A4Z2ILG0_9TELE|nr:Glycogenin-1 [Liparis tanakae]
MLVSSPHAGGVSAVTDHVTRKMWGLIPVLDCSQLLSSCTAQCKPSVCPITTSAAREDSTHHTMSDQAFVTLATNDAYARGAMVLGQSLLKHNTTKKLVALIGPHVSEPCRDALGSIFHEVLLVDVMDSGDTAHLSLMKRPDLGVTFTKLHCWSLTHYSKCVFMDADTLVLSNIDELFEREELSAAPDPGWPDCFNSGVFVFRPYGREAKVVHFLGKVKPWSYSYDPQRGEVKGHSLSPDQCHLHPDYLLMWWRLYAESVQPLLQRTHGDAPFDSGLVDAADATPHEDGSEGSAAAAPPPKKASSEERKQRWEAGQIDYMGDDSFDNIARKLDSFLKGPASFPRYQYLFPSTPAILTVGPNQNARCDRLHVYSSISALMSSMRDVFLSAFLQPKAFSTRVPSKRTKLKPCSLAKRNEDDERGRGHADSLDYFNLERIYDGEEARKLRYDQTLDAAVFTSQPQQVSHQRLHLQERQRCRTTNSNDEAAARHLLGADDLGDAGPAVDCVMTGRRTESRQTEHSSSEPLANTERSFSIRRSRISAGVAGAPAGKRVFDTSRVEMRTAYRNV